MSSTNTGSKELAVDFRSLRKRNRHQTETELELTSQPRRRSFRAPVTELCEKRALMDFYRMIDVHGIGVQLCRFSEAVRNVGSCVFCQLIVRFADEKYESRQQVSQSEMICTLRRRVADPEDYVERKGMSIYARLLLVIRHQCQDGDECSGISCFGNVFHLEAKSLLLDRVGMPPTGTPRYQSTIMVRKPVSTRIEDLKIQHWIRQGERRKERQVKGQSSDFDTWMRDKGLFRIDTSNKLNGLLLQSSTREIPALDELLSDDRLRMIDVSTSQLVTLSASNRYIALSYV